VGESAGVVSRANGHRSGRWPRLPMRLAGNLGKPLPIPGNFPSPRCAAPFPWRPAGRPCTIGSACCERTKGDAARFTVSRPRCGGGIELRPLFFPRSGRRERRRLLATEGCALASSRAVRYSGSSRRDPILSIHGRPHSVCEGVSRRELLQAAGAGLFGMTLPDLLHAESTAPSGKARARSVIFLFLFGGRQRIEDDVRCALRSDTSR
jgi:hypothetical protein